MMFKSIIEKESAKLQVQQVLRDDEASTFPSEASSMIDAGILEYFIPSHLGGKMESIQETLELGRLLSRRNLTSAIALGQTLLGSLPVWLYGSTEQKKSLAHVLRNKGLGCLALTEQINGSDLSLTQTTDSNGEISGEKWCINNATLGRMMSVLTINEAGLLNVHLILKDSPFQGSYTNIPKINTLGIRGADISGITLNSFKQANSQLGKSGQGLEIILKTMQISRLLCASFSLGAADTTLRLALEFSQTRLLYGKSIIDLPAVKSKLLASYKKLLLIEAFSLISSRLITMAPEVMSLYSAISKYYVTKLSDEIITSSTEVLGARFYIRDSEFGITQKMMRDHRVVSLFDGNSDVNMAIIAGQIKRLNTIGELKNDVEEIFTVRRKATQFSGDEALKLTSRGRDIIWETIAHYPFTSSQMNSFLSKREEIFSKINTISDIQSVEMLDMVHKYCELTLEANYFIFKYFNKNDFVNEIDPENLVLPFEQVSRKHLISHFTCEIND